MNMYKYKATEGDVELYNETEREFLYGEYYDIQLQKDGDWYSIQPLTEIAYKDIVYSLKAGSGNIYPPCLMRLH